MAHQCKPLASPPPGLPASITRDQLLQVAELLGVDPMMIRSMRLTCDSLTVDYYMHDGDRLATLRLGEDQVAAAAFTIDIPVVC